MAAGRSSRLRTLRRVVVSGGLFTRARYGCGGQSGTVQRASEYRRHVSTPACPTERTPEGYVSARTAVVGAMQVNAHDAFTHLCGTPPADRPDAAPTML